ncbi:DUF5602 domain-containing protein [Rufibacter psychrotolerans]|uniref:DUF5602 domain-containing protein n=1 Tax=Rufibacter psychrotolerans TaxID=2812556 RepID=UPI00196754AE|nr:DUF5602 domain-containing protein [Rufibacter sp. SYSU D00308]
MDKPFSLASRLLSGALLFLSFLLPACSDDDEDNLEGTFYGAPVAVGQGTAKAWVTTNAAGTPTAVGITLSEGALSNLGNAMRMYTLPLPQQANQTLYNHVMLDWNPQGHEPPGLYNVPHFDAHFYMIPEAEVANIEGQAAMDEEAEARFVPQNYILTPGVVPGMGAHWIDVTDQNNAPGQFARNFLYGSIDGNFIFHEPMFTLAYLTSLTTRGGETIAVPQPSAYQKAGLYPMRYGFSYNSTTKEYTISLLDLTERQ